MATMITPDPSRRFQVWAAGEVWVGPQGTGEWVPNVNDLIYNPATDQWTKVIQVNYTNGLSQTTPVSFRETGGATDSDVLIGVGPGTNSEAWRIHCTMQFTPFEARFDTRLHVYGEEASYVKVYKDTDFANPSSVISAIYDQNNQWVSDNIPVEGTGQIRTLPKFFLKESVEMSQPLYARVFNAAGVPIGLYQMLAHVTDFLPSGNVAVKHITGIELISKYLSDTETDVLEIPKNVPIAGLVLTARVHYSGMASVDYPVDGSKFTLLNIQPFLAAITDQTLKIRLKYLLGLDESGDSIYNNGDERFITRQYTIKVMPTDHSYSVKLMNFLDWDAGNNRYWMVSYLYNLDREESRNVSNLITFGVTGDAFTGIPGQGLRNHVVSVDMEDIDPNFANFRYTQVVPAECVSPGNSTDTRWRINNYQDNQEMQNAIVATALNETTHWRLHIDNDEATLNDWLDATYYAQEPLFNSEDESGPMVPTHIRIVYGGESVQLDITNWNSDIVFPAGVTFTTGRLLMVEFIRVEGGDTFILGGCGFTVTQL